MLAPSLQPSERRVAEAIAADVEAAIERTAQEVARVVGVGRASVVRTAQSLDYEGYPQLRVALAREVALNSSTADDEVDGSMLGMLRGAVDRFAGRLSHTVSALTEENLQDFVRVLDESERVLVAANGLSAPLGLDLAMRLCLWAARWSTCPTRSRSRSPPAGSAPVRPAWSSRARERAGRRSR